ncbi:MAG: hypothetical protein Q4A36_01905 [Candidatus Saccharibacteria bacterium]|nr:hypothetical protein [Candidatus Saccharibacteria bacterium]
MKNNFIKRIFGWSGVTSLIAIMIGLSIAHDTFAANSYSWDEVKRKITISSIIDCYDGGGFASDTILKNTDSKKVIKTKPDVYSVEDYKTTKENCNKFITSIKNTTWTDDNLKPVYLKGLGYKPVGVDVSEFTDCRYLIWRTAGGMSYYTDKKICVMYDKNANNKILDVSVKKHTLKKDSSNHNYLRMPESLVKISLVGESSVKVEIGGRGYDNGKCTKRDKQKVIISQDRGDPAAFFGALVDGILNNGGAVIGEQTIGGVEGGEKICISYTYNDLSDASTGEDASPFGEDQKFELKVTDEVKKNGVNFLTGQMPMSGAKPSFSEPEKFITYQNYLLGHYGPKVCCLTSITENQKKAIDQLGWKRTTLYGGGEYNTCYVGGINPTDTMGGFNGTTFGGNAIADYNSVISGLNSFSTISRGVSIFGTVNIPPNDCPENIIEEEQEDEGASKPNPGKPINQSTTDNSEIVDCNDFTTVGPMQWLLCPTMNNMEYTASWLDNMSQKFLEVKTSVYDNDDIENAWGLVRNIANGLMVLFFLIVVISQLTGYGIDNYGIKKMLPRLILIAILMNLSIYICQALVDVSNIAGTGLRDMFGGIANGVDKVGEPSYVGTAVGGLIAAASTGGPAVATTAPAITAILGPSVVAIIILVIIALLAIAIAVLILLLAVGARQVIIMFCVLISPFAFVAYVLPNTQQLFKKWAELFKAALIVFPILGALSGISQLLRSLEDGAELPWYTHLILLVLPYLGFFLIPMLLTNAISALGKVGAALTSMGNTVRSAGRNAVQGGLKAVQGTEGYKNAQEEAARTKRIRDAARRVGRFKGRNYGNLSDSEKRQWQKAQDILNQAKYEQEGANIGPPVEVTDAAAVNYADAQRRKKLSDDYELQYSGMTRSGLESALNNSVKAYADNRNESTEAALLGAIKNASARGMDKEMLNGALGNIVLNSSDSHDSRIIDQMAATSSLPLSSFGKDMGKSENLSMSLNDYASGGGPISLASNIEGKGPNQLNGVNDDILGYMKEKGTAINTQTLLNAAGNATDNKQLKEIIDLLKNNHGKQNYSLSMSELAKLKPELLDPNQGTVKGRPALDPSTYTNALNEIKATMNTDPTRQLINSMPTRTRELLGLPEVLPNSPPDNS